MSAQGSDPLEAAMLEIALVIAAELHRVDGQAAGRINFAAAKVYNRLLASGDPRAAEIVYRFGRALTDRDMFPEAKEKEAGTGPASSNS